MPVPHSSYRLQIHSSFDLHAAADACDYLATLGVGSAYLSPLLPSARGSDHGYDVTGFDTIDAQRGGIDAWTRLLAAARARGLGVVCDIVPNHTGVGDAAQNPFWWDVLRLGRESSFAHWFDIDWSRGRVLLPVLGDAFDPVELEVVDDELRYYEHRFPLAPGTGPEPGESAAQVHARQHYELVSHRRADTEHNYRRFFAVAALAGLRVEDDEVFDATHAQIRRWLQADGVEGLRVDHPDGLADPRGYLTRLRDLAGTDAWIVVEKILEPGEILPADWPVDGTTGYDALAEVSTVMIDPSSGSALDALYREITDDTMSFAEHTQAGKRLAVQTILAAEVARLARFAPGVERAEDAIRELLVALGVYRTYLPEGARYLSEAITTALARRPDLSVAISALAARLSDPADELCVRFQQLSGAVTAKGVEDTAYYRYTRFVALNEVGGDPGAVGCGPEEFHRAQVRRQHSAPRSMTTLSTHDTKRGEDVRARLAVVSELPHEWGALVRELMVAAPVPDRSLGYLLWQTFVGAGFIDRGRMHAYAEKAMREAATVTSWVDPDAQFEARVHAAVDAAYDVPEVHGPLAGFVARITPYGWTNSLSQKLIQLTMPGVPDVYQGTELLRVCLVDPDNRREVDFARRRAMLEALDRAATPPAIDESGAAKLWVVSRALRLRRDRPELFSEYRSPAVRGPASEHAVCFDRGGAITVATRLPLALQRAGGWRDTTLDLGAGGVDVVSGAAHQGVVSLSELLRAYPVALLAR